MKIVVALGISIISEVVASSSLKLTDGFKKIKPTVMVLFFYVLSFYCLSIALTTLPIGKAYAIWGGLGTVLTSLVGTFRYQEKMTAKKIVAIALIILGVIVLNLLGGGH